MSIVRKTLDAFPRGRTTEELLVLLGATFDEGKRRSVIAELQVIAEAGLARQDRDGRWKSVVAVSAPANDAQALASPRLNDLDQDLLFAIPASFDVRRKPIEVEAGDDGAAMSVDPNALLRYWRSALRSDPRGAITQTPDRHGSQWILATGTGPLTPDQEAQRVITFALDALPAEFRQALLRREANEMTLAVGWPVMVGRKAGSPAIWPVGLLAAEWSRTEGTLRVVIDADDVLVNPDWLEGAARSAGWQKSELQNIFLPTDGIGLQMDDFLLRLREAAAKHLRGKITGVGMASQIDLAASAIYDIAGLFLPSESTFTAGAVRDLDAIAAWPVAQLSGTALAPLLGLPANSGRDGIDDVNVGPLNGEQINAVRHAVGAPLTVVTGPPGTGKSQAIVSMAASVLLKGGTVLVASKNHQALDAVEDRLGGLAADLPFLVRTLDPQREIDRSLVQVMADLLNDAGQRVRPIDAEVMAHVSALSADRRRALDRFARHAELECEIAALVERIAARARFATIEQARPRQVDDPPPRLFIRLWRAIAALLHNSPKPHVAAQREPLPEGAPTAALQARLATLRIERDALADIDDPVRLTEDIAKLAAAVLPAVLSHAVALREDQRQALENARADFQFHGERHLPFDVTQAVLAHRPLWLASVLGTPKRIPLEAGLFDLVIFDEASQCDIASALPLFARAKRAVVVGDDRQLSFVPQLGQAQDRNLMKAQGLPNFGMGRYAQSRQSLFDFAKRVPNVPRVLLRHQYRSAGPIVDYISETFYGGQLTTSYDPKTIRPPQGQKPGIAWSHVPGPALAQQGNVNHPEAEAIAAHIQLLLIEQGYQGSIGVISPFRPQVQLIERVVIAKVPAQKLEGAEFRVATVDGFQGQERDLILFSPCLAHASAMSAVTFVQKDLRRLNVAISRARAVAHVFGDLDYARSAKIRALARLAAVATEPRARVGEGVFDSGWERRVYDALQGRGLDPQPQYEIAGRRLDFALFGKTGVKLDLEVDGRHWHQDTDGRRKIADHWRDHQLMSMGWRVRRFWVDELSQNMEACLDLVERDLS
jgi:very-short-patch-repair endonuclease